MDDFIMAVKTHNVTPQEFAAILCSVEGLEISDMWMVMIKDKEVKFDSKVGQPFTGTIVESLKNYQEHNPTTILFGVYDSPVHYASSKNEPPNYHYTINGKTVIGFSEIKYWNAEAFLKNVIATPTNNIITHCLEDEITKACVERSKELYVNMIERTNEDESHDYIVLASNSNYFAYKAALILNIFGTTGNKYDVVFDAKLEDDKESNDYIIEAYVNA
jgi:hypothetical protein